MNTRSPLQQAYAVASAFAWDGPWTMFLENALTAIALEAARIAGRRETLFKRNAAELSLIRRLTRALELATDPFNTTYEIRARIRVEFGL